MIGRLIDVYEFACMFRDPNDRDMKPLKDDKDPEKSGLCFECLLFVDNTS